ncbi:hypothetical protein [Yinghuangia seranimata]|uniref:hypothetical protein n=1 Tax=Yinghuangia seranimata TaxID=408067 RepID=UPI00248C540A|nr:hypothetical protein [Yinghuangia seranimata]MDI2131496.1 hypothetical protein [Yinghuangia seranimata]
MADLPVPVVVPEAEVRSLVTAEAALRVTREALVAQAAGAVSQPEPWHLEVPSAQGEVHIKGAHIHGATHFAAKYATGFYRNKELGLPTGSGLSIVADAETGFPVAIALDNGYLTDVRTGAAGAAAAAALARPDADAVGLIGIGVQAGYQIEALLQVRNPSRLFVYGRDRAAADAFAERMRTLHPWSVAVVDSAEAAVRPADIVVTVTPSRDAIVQGAWLRPGAHVTAVGADMEGKRELALDVLTRADVVAADDVAQCLRVGELQYAAAAGVVERLRLVALGDVIAGRAAGRTSPDQITVADLTGIGAEDAAIGSALVEALAAQAS